jgi:hypothetical protein
MSPLKYALTLTAKTAALRTKCTALTIKTAALITKTAQ